jgi:7-carboxy-7-deazaguanine synthase
MDQMPKLEISELFFSIQGESTYAGLPCVFIRLHGCNLRCSYCDARYTYEEQEQQMEIAEILAYTDRYPEALIEITGGEPLLQDSLYPLLTELLSRQRKVLVESNGSLPIARIPDGVTMILDVKSPGSGQAQSFCQGNLREIRQRAARLPGSCEIKFVLTDRNDYEWAKKMVTEMGLSQEVPVLFSPVTNSFTPAELAELILADQLQVRLQLQLHTRIWPSRSRGV